MIDKSALQSAKVRLALLIIALAFSFGVYRILKETSLSTSGLLFIGVPAILAIIVAISPPAKSTVGIVFRVITIALLLSGILFIEGAVCIVMAAPLFYLVGLAIALLVDWSRRESARRRTGALLIAPLLFMSFEGVTPATSFDRSESVTSVRHIQASPGDVQNALSQTPDFDRQLPLFLRTGFPRPSRSEGSGLAVGDRRTIYFPTRMGVGVLEFEVTRSQPGRVTFKVVRDTTVYRQWLEIEEADVRWSPAASGGTTVSWTLRFERRLDPVWYFSPLERYGTHLAAGYLIDTLATPETN